MPFTEALKLKIKQKSNWQCCICEAYYVEVHHIISQEEGGPDTEDNAAPLCPNCHDIYGPNSRKRKFIKEKRNDWYAKCKNKYLINSLVETLNKRLEKVVTIEELKGFEKNLLSKINVKQPQESQQNLGFKPSLNEDIKNLIKQKEFVKAVNVLKERLSEYHYLLGYVYGEKEEYIKMMNEFDESLSISKNFESDIKSSKNYYWANLFNKGVKEYQQGVNAKDKGSGKVHLDKAAESFENAIKIEADSVDTYKNLAFVYMNQGDMDKAVDLLKVVIDKEHSLDGYRYLGQILYQKGVKQREADSVTAKETFNETIKILEDGRKYYPNNQDILVTLSNSYIAADKLDVAMDVFKAGVELEPQNKYYHYDYGVLLLDAGQFEEAEKQFKSAVNIDSTYENALYNLGVTYIKWGTAINKAAEGKGDITNAYREKYQMALPYMEEVTQMKPNDSSLWELLGRIYTILGEEEKAKKAFKKSDSLIESI